MDHRSLKFYWFLCLQAQSSSSQKSGISFSQYPSCAHQHYLFIKQPNCYFIFIKKKQNPQYLIFLIHLNLKQTSKSDLLEQRWERKGANLTLLCWQNQNGSKKNLVFYIKIKNHKVIMLWLSSVYLWQCICSWYLAASALCLQRGLWKSSLFQVLLGRKCSTLIMVKMTA